MYPFHTDAPCGNGLPLFSQALRLWVPGSLVRFQGFAGSLRRPSRTIGRIELQRRAVHAVAHPGWLRAVGKHMPQVPAAFRAVDFGPGHAVTLIDRRRDGVGPKRRPETRPPGAALVLALGGEQRLATAGAPEGAGAFFLVQRARSARLGAVLAKDVALLGSQCSLGHDSV